MEIDFPKITLDLIYESSDDEKQDRPNTFKREESASVSRCVSISAADLDSIKRSRHEANTVKQTSWAVNCFKTWLSERKIQIDLKTIEKHEFGAILRELYATTRTTKGELYSISSYAGLQAGLNRYINEPPLGRMWNMMQDIYSCQQRLQGCPQTNAKGWKGQVSTPPTDFISGPGHP